MKNRKSGKKNSYGRDTFSFDEPVRKKDERKNGKKRSADNDDDLVGKLAYSDVYVIGKSAKIDLTGEKRLNSRQRAGIQDIEDSLNRKKIVGVDDFIQYYDKAQKIAENDPESPKNDSTVSKNDGSDRKISNKLKKSKQKDVFDKQNEDQFSDQNVSGQKNEVSCQDEKNDKHEEDGELIKNEKNSLERSADDGGDNVLNAEDEKESIRRNKRKARGTRNECGMRNERSDKSEKFEKYRDKRGANTGSEPGERGKAVGLRVIGGSLRGTKLQYSGDHRVRPMKDRVREAVFNLIGTDAAGRHVVDLFAGTGALAFEAISRGAQSATMIEVHFPTARVTRTNIGLLDDKMPGIKDRIDLITTDVFFFGRITDNIKSRIPTDLPWLVFCSPPYDFYIDREEEMMQLIRNFRQCAPKNSLFVIEADARFNFDLLEVLISPKKRRSYPPAEVALFYTVSQ